ncbi:acetyl-CoA carboxylase biotin carboxyl carrier protein [Halarcobacter anaerophilus]|uniref:acetyl-CoA carboxylase biotin carboxyl carrier protein n=1 Tax=Halarcobacter anaerophilus TaxID=877500 RepID=UPI0005C80609|nr:acetyl-CoA carboxylase biotin carboxyl carrier protein [Halarcobacter anaerophilus]
MDFKEIKELIRVFDKSELNKLKVKEGEFEVSMQKGFEGNTVVTTAAPVSAPVAAAPVPVATASAAPAAEAAPAISGDTINSPMVGTYYSSPSPESQPFVKEGDTIKQGQTLCILEAMKIMNEVEAEFDCKILKILVDNASPVEYDMPLFVVEKL